MRILRNGKRVGFGASVLGATAGAQGQMPQALPGQPLIDEHALKQASEHVYALVGWPTWDKDQQ